MKPKVLTMRAFGPYAGEEVIDFSSFETGLFLVTGPTGSGKTTIFDALKYALYGVTSDEVRDARDMRSAHAAPDLLTEIELIFEHGGREYQIKRRPAQLRPKKRGEGMLETKPEASLEDLTGFISLASKDSDVTAQVIDLLGVDADQFSRIVMIAQNDFAQVLNAKTREREALFRKIFGTAFFAHIQEELDARRKELDSQIIESRMLIGAELSHISRPADPRFTARFDALMDDVARDMHQEEFVAFLSEVIEAEKTYAQRLEKQVSSLKAKMGELDAKIGRSKILAQAKINASDADRWLSENEDRIHLAKARLEELEKNETKRDDIRSQINVLESALLAFDQLKEDEKALEKATKKLLNHRRGLEKLNNDFGVLKVNRTELDDELASLKDVDLHLAELSQKQERLDVSRNELEAIVGLSKEVSKNKQMLSAAQQRLTSAEDSFSELNEMFAKAQRLFNADKAGMLAETLNGGDACPVCGSTEHPKLAKRQEGAPTEAELEELGKDLDQARDLRDEAASKAASLRAVADAKQEELAKKAQSFLGILPDDLEAVLSEKKAFLAEENEQLTAERSRLQEQKKRTEELKAEIESSDEKIYALQTQIESKQKASTELERAQEQALTRCNAIREGLSFADKGEASKELELLSGSLAQELSALSEARTTHTELLNTQSQKRALLDSARQTLESADDPMDEGLEEEREKTAIEEKVCADELSELKSALANHELCRDKLKELSQNMHEIEKRFVAIDRIARLATGKSAGLLGKVSFETFVQGAYFDRVLLAANNRLTIMSSGRYSLVRRESSSDKRASAGLELDVLDRYTGTSRPVNTLSGGETFLASLALALGLSDTIMAQAGGMHIDAMFIDEGFGTLDEETCQLAIEVLGKLSSDERMIGIISHVDELKERIPVQVQVTKTRSGSTVDVIG